MFEIDDSPSGATFDHRKEYRYLLWRRWKLDAKAAECLAVIGLNPSKADEKIDDPTIRRCIGFAKAWGHGGLIMLNLFAYRATDPQAMMKIAEPVGADNDAAIRTTALAVPQIICAWGVHGVHLYRDCDVITALKDVAAGKIFHLGLTKDGCPRHPLYLKGDLKPVAWF